MQYLTFVLVALIVPLCNALATRTLAKRYFRPDYYLTNLTVRHVPDGSSNLSFNILHPAPLTNFTGICTASWSQPDATGVRLKCPFKIQSSIEYWHAPNDFGLYIQQTYEDPSVGQPDWLTVFAHGHVNQSQVACFSCDGKPTGTMTCKEPSAATITGAITSMIAKK